MLDEPSRKLIAYWQAQAGPSFDQLPIDVLRTVMDGMTAVDAPGPAVARVEDFQAVMPHATVTARLYHPHENTEQPLPLLIYYHGGGWISWSVQSHDPICRRICDAGQFAVLSVEYRMAPEHPFPAAVDDAYGIVGWARNQAATLNIDPTRIGVAGDSAGGNLAAVVTQLVRGKKDLPLCFQALLYPVTDCTMSLPSYQEHASDGSLSASTMRHFINTYVPSEIDRKHPGLSPLFNPDFRNLPPALLIVAEYDPLRDDGFEYAKRLKSAGVPTRVEHFADAMHGFVSMGGLIGPQSGLRAVRLIAEEFTKSWARFDASES